MKCEIIAVGTELLLGQIVDTNSSWMGEHLALAGIDSHYQTKVGDNWDRIEDAVRLGLERSDAVIMCGGLGPTQDDITRDVIARVMGTELVMDDVIADRIRAMFESRGRTMPENNLRQALVPVGATTIPQQPGTAPGLVAPITQPDGSEKVIYAVPGVPYEMKEMVEGTVIPDLQERAGVRAVIDSRVLRTWGQSESGLAEMLADRIDDLDAAGNPTLAFLASGVEGIKVRITAKADDRAGVDAMLDAEETVLREILGDLVFALDDDNMEAAVLGHLAERGLSLGVMETVTSGLHGEPPGHRRPGNRGLRRGRCRSRLGRHRPLPGRDSRVRGHTRRCSAPGQDRSRRARGRCGSGDHRDRAPRSRHRRAPLRDGVGGGVDGGIRDRRDRTSARRSRTHPPVQRDLGAEPPSPSPRGAALNCR